MDESRFWKIVDKTLPAAGDRVRQEELLWDQLIGLPPDEVAAFAWWFDWQIDRSDCDNVHVAWDLIVGVGADDGYHDFRCWLVSRGRAAFMAALADPDSFSDLVTPEEEDRHEEEEERYVFMDFWCVAPGVYEQLTGEECPDDPAPQPPAPPAERWYARDAAEVQRRMPRLWTRFGLDAG